MEKKIFIQPGYVYLPKEFNILYTVTGSGICITMFDKILSLGGACYYIYPKRKSIEDNKTYFAYPAITTLFNLMLKKGAKPENMEANICGGGENKSALNFKEHLSSENINIGIEILNKYNISINNNETGGKFGRKIVFHPFTGEIFITTEETIRASDWYPERVGS